MTPLRLDHVTLTSTSLGRSVAFFEEILDLRPGFRPDLGVGGAWLYTERDPAERQAFLRSLGCLAETPRASPVEPPDNETNVAERSE